MPETPLPQPFEWLLRDRTTGAITIAQWPNAPLWLFAGASLAGLLVQPESTGGTILRVLAVGALAVWAADEILRGVNPWRRLLGGGVALWLALRLGGAL